MAVLCSIYIRRRDIINNSPQRKLCSIFNGAGDGARRVWSRSADLPIKIQLHDYQKRRCYTSCDSDEFKRILSFLKVFANHTARLCVEIVEKTVCHEGVRDTRRNNLLPDSDTDEEDDEGMRYDCCDDPDGASSGDEEYGTTKGRFAQEEEEMFYLPPQKRGESSMPDFLQIERGSVELAVGQRYPTKKNLELRLKMLSVALKFDYNVGYSTPTLLTVHCWIEGCSWRARAPTLGSAPEFFIKSYVKDHSCSVTERSSRSRQAKPDLLGRLYSEFVGCVGPTVLPCHVADALNKRYGVKMDYWKAHHTLRFARQLVAGSSESGYEDLPAYLYMIRRANLGTLIMLDVDEEDMFKFLFIDFAASIHGFPHMRKVVVVDATYLQGKYKGTLLTASTQDGNFNIFPIAFGVVDTENHESWEWTRECYGLVKKAASAYRLLEFNQLFAQIQALDPALHKYLVEADVRLWTRVYFPGNRYNFTTSNIAESLNNVLSPFRGSPIVQLLDAARALLTRWFAARRKNASLMKTTLTRGVEKLLESRVEDAKLGTAQEIDGHQSQVTCGGVLHVVNLTEKKCTCRRFDLDKLPCVHAIAAAEAKGMSQIALAHTYFRRTSLYNSYAKNVMPRDVSFPVPENVIAKLCKPPVVHQPPGRPKNSRMKSALEVAMENKRPRKENTCGKCNKIGHNRATCKT
ncbi:unnamed protein product [Microthlaspi erraticum]|uniref:SWIM-type domain-containing protein n=1 Tax=Microthlaspi erraticum TaxID=1685480 RepID=A0A6D2HSU9_9BRAS|nr:unnamed protein product [Microthlaspi erraticum]